jgi:hypothetical protein
VCSERSNVIALHISKRKFDSGIHGAYSMLLNGGILLDDI